MMRTMLRTHHGFMVKEMNISNSNGYDISKMKNITEEEGMNKWDEYSNNIKGYTISFFSNYTPKKSKEDIDAGIYEKFIKNGEYNNYLTSDWEYGMPSQYAVLDIDVMELMN